jgi:hypothetical protein
MKLNKIKQINYKKSHLNIKDYELLQYIIHDIKRKVFLADKDELYNWKEELNKFLKSDEDNFFYEWRMYGRKRIKQYVQIIKKMISDCEDKNYVLYCNSEESDL